MRMDLPDDVQRGVEDLAKAVAKNKMAAQIEIIEAPKKKHDHKDLKGEIEMLLDSWGDHDGNRVAEGYYKDLESLVRKTGKPFREEDEDGEEEEEEEHVEEDEVY